MLRFFLFFALCLSAAGNARGQTEIRIRVCSFAEVTEDVYEGLGKEIPFGALETLGFRSPLSDSLARLLSQFIIPLPKRRVVSSTGEAKLVPVALEDSKAKGFFRFSSKDSFAANDLVLAGLFFRDGEQFSASLYLASKGKEEAYLLGSMEGAISRLEEFAPALGPLALLAVSNRDILIRDLRTNPRTSSLSASKDSSVEIAGSRIFIERGKTASIEIGSEGYLSMSISLPADEGKTYAQVEALLRLDPAKPKAAIPDILSGAGRAVGWETKKEYQRENKGFENALGRLLISIPVSALSLGGFFLSYESYTRLGTGSTTLYAGAALAGASLVATALCIVDVGFRMASKIKIAR
jgi:hypothetical protein